MRVTLVTSKFLAAAACQGSFCSVEFTYVSCTGLCFTGAEGTKGEGEPVLHKIQVAGLGRGAERERAADRGNSGKHCISMRFSSRALGSYSGHMVMGSTHHV